MSEKSSLDQLECHFTWGLKKDDLDLTDLHSRLKEQVSLKEEIAQAKSSLGYLEFLLENKEEALNNLLESEKLIKEKLGNNCEKTLIVTYGNLAWVYFHMNEFSECQSYLDKLEVIKKTFATESSSGPEVLGEKGWALLKFSHNYYDKAKEVFKRALEIDPDNRECNAGYAVALYRSAPAPCSAPCTVLKQLKLAINKNPNDDVLKVFLAIHYLPCSKGVKKEEAEKLVETALKGSPEHPHVLRYAAIFYRDIGSVDRAIEKLEEALEYSTKSSKCFIYHQLGVCYKTKKINLHKENKGKTDEIDEARNQSINYLEKVISSKPSFIIAMIELAVQYGERGELDKAEEMFKKAFETADKNNEHQQVVRFYYAQFQEYSNKRRDLAIKYYRDCYEINPQTTEGQKSAEKLESEKFKKFKKM